MDNDWKKPYIGLFLYAFLFIGVAFITARPAELLEGMQTKALRKESIKAIDGT